MKEASQCGAVRYTLDTPEVLKPGAHLWTSRKLPWFPIPEGLTVYDTQPE